MATSSSAAYNAEDTNNGEDISKHDSKEAFRFLDLPPELRNEIYSTLLKARNTIRVTRHKKEPQGNTLIWRPRLSNKRVEYLIKAETLAYADGRQRKLAFATATPLAILRVNKVVHQEAAAIFYGANEFVFSNVYAFQEFKKMTRGFSFLKILKIKGVRDPDQYNSNTRDTFVGLKDPKCNILEIVTDPKKEDSRGVPVVAEWLWTQVAGYLLDRAFFEGPLYLERGMTSENLEDYELRCKKRLNALVFIAPDGLVSRLKDDSTHQHKGQEEITTILKEQLLPKLALLLRIYADGHARIVKEREASAALKQLGSESE